MKRSKPVAYCNPRRRDCISALTIAFFLCANVCIEASAQAATLNVPAQYAEIQQAIDAAGDGDTVLISPGTYRGQINFNGKAITVTSRDGPANTTIDAMSAGNVVVFDSGEVESSVISGLTIQNGSANFGAGIIVIGASPHIVGNIFHSNGEMAGGFGAAIGGSGSPLIEKNLFYSNTCSENDSLSGVISLVNGSQPVIVNNVFRDNTSCPAINITEQDGFLHEITNNTMVRNLVGIYVDSRTGMQHQLLRNNIIVDNHVGIDDGFSSTGLGWPDCESNLVYNNEMDYRGMDDQTGNHGNISADPLFVNSAQTDFHLLVGSPAIGAGNLIAPPALPIDDFDSKPRSSTTMDMGAIAYRAGGSNPPPPTSGPSGGGGGGSIDYPILIFLLILAAWGNVKSRSTLIA